MMIVLTSTYPPWLWSDVIEMAKVTKFFNLILGIGCKENRMRWMFEWRNAFILVNYHYREFEENYHSRERHDEEWSLPLSVSWLVYARINKRRSMHEQTIQILLLFQDFDCQYINIHTSSFLNHSLYPMVFLSIGIYAQN